MGALQIYIDDDDDDDVTRPAMPAVVTVHTIVFNVHLALTILFLYW